MDTLILFPLPVEIAGDRSRHSCLLRKEGGGETTESTLYYDIPAELENIREDDCDVFLLASVMLAMRENRDLDVRGGISHQLLENIEEFMHAWTLWKPARYHAIRITAENLVENNRYPGATRSAVAAFSGGVDATHLVWSWLKHRPDPEWYPLRRVVFVHGFDIHVADDSYHIAFAESQGTLRSVGLELDSIRTNLREVIPVPWVDLCGIALASCLHFYKRNHSRGLIASSTAYDFLIIPWGTNPILDHLLSSHEFRISHEGCRIARTGKIRVLSEWAGGSSKPPGLLARRRPR